MYMIALIIVCQVGSVSTEFGKIGVQIVSEPSTDLAVTTSFSLSTPQRVAFAQDRYNLAVRGLLGVEKSKRLYYFGVSGSSQTTSHDTLTGISKQVLNPVTEGFSGWRATIPGLFPDDIVTVTLAGSPTIVDEGGSVKITATISQSLSTDVVVPLVVRAGGSAEPSDYGPLPTITIPGNSTSANGTLTIPVETDANDNDDEEFTVEIDETRLSLTVVPGHQKWVDVTILDNARPKPVLSPPVIDPFQEGSSETFSIQLTGPPLGRKVRVRLSQRSGEAIPVTLDKEELEFTKSNWSTDQVVTVSHADNNKIDTDGTLHIDVEVLGGTVRRTGYVELHFKDNDRPKVTLSASPNPVDEGGSVTITAAISEDLATDVIVPLTVLPGGSAEVGDYGPLPTITIPGARNLTSANGTLTIPTEADANDRDDELFTLAIDESGLPSTVVAGNPKSVEVTILDSARPKPVLSPPVIDPFQEGSSETFSIQLTGPPLGRKVRVRLSQRSGEAIPVTLDKEELEFTKSNWSTDQVVTVSHADNNKIDTDGTLHIDVEVLGGTVRRTGYVELHFKDNDRPKVTLSASPNPVDEGEQVTITATISEDPVNDVEISFKIIAGTAESSDYGSISGGFITIRGAGNATSGRFILSTLEDNAEQDDETFMVVLGRLPQGVAAGDPSEVEVTIIDDDKVTVNLSASPNPVNEGGSVTVTATISEDPASDVVIPLILTAGAAEAGDYGALPDITIPGTGSATTGMGTIVIPQESDVTDWEDETFTVAIDESGLPSTVVAVDPKSVLVTIIDDDKPTVHLSASPNPVSEGQSVTVTVMLSEDPASDVVIPLTLTAGTAEAGDYGTLSTITIPGAGSVMTGTGTIMIPQESDVTDWEDETFMVAINESGLPSTVVAVAPKSVLVTITDDDKPTIRLSASPNPVSEGQSVKVTVTLSEDPASDVVIPLILTAGTAEAGDYGALSDITIPGTGSATTGMGMIVIPQESDVTDWEDETFTVMIDESNLPATVVIGNPKSALITITDDDKPTITLSASPNSVEEGQSVTVTATISEDPASDVVIPLILTAGTAEAGDYGALSSITIPGNGSVKTGTGTIMVPQESDVTDWEDETFTVAIDESGLPSTVVAVDPKSVLVTIIDDDKPTITLTAFPNPVLEGTGSGVVITVTTSKDLVTDMIIPLTLTAGTAEVGDYGILPSITILGGVLSGTGTIMIPQESDVNDKEDETFTVVLNESSLPSTVVAGNPKSALITITDDEKPTIVLYASPNAVPEGSELSLSVALVPPPSSPFDTEVQVPVMFISGTAQPQDYGSPPQRVIITIPTKGYSGSKDFFIPEDADSGDETFTVLIDEHTIDPRVRVGDMILQEVAITDKPAVSLSATTSVGEGDDLEVTVMLVGTPLPRGERIPLTLIPVTAEQEDYGNLRSISVPLLPGSGVARGTIQTYPDTDSDDDTFTLEIDASSLPSTVVAGAPTSVLVTISEKPTITLSANPNPVDEGDAVTVTARLSGALPAAVTIPLTYRPGAVDPAETGDYGSLASITIAANALTGTGTITTVKDADSDDETFTVALGSLPSEVVAGTPSSVLVTIREKPAVSLSANPNPVDEGSSVTVTATLSQALPAAVTIPLTLTPGTAEKGDYGGLASITIAANSLEGTGTITTVRDTDFDDETFTVALGSLPSEVAAGSPSSELVTITDLDTPTVSLSASPNPVDEGKAVTVTARLSRALPAAVTIPLTLTPGTAEKGDYGSLASITIAANALEGTGTITTVRDTDSDDETFTVALGSLPSEVAAGSPSSELVTITDLDTPTVSLSASPNPVDEGKAVTVTARLSSALPAAVTIPLTLTPGTAEKGDYGSLASITIAANSLEGTGTITTVRDTDFDDETFTVALGSLPSEVAAGSPSSELVTITDLDTPTVSLSASPNPVKEGSSVTVTATLSSALSTSMTIPLTLTPGTAEKGDYGSLASITIAANSLEGTGTITTVRDTDFDDETFTVALGDLPSEVVEGSPSSEEVEITDLDTPPVTPAVHLSATTPVDEGSSVTVTATLSSALPAAVTIPLTLTPGTAEKGDYGSLASITIAANALEGTGTITTVRDTDFDDETFTVALGSLPSGVAAGAPSSVEVTITDLDTPTVSLSANPNPVDEGKAVTVTARLSRALPAAVTIPLTLTPGTAEKGDYGSLASITIAANALEGTGTITTVRDTDSDDETFTVALGSLPSGVAAGTPSSVEVTITDLDTPTVSLFASPNPVDEGKAVTVTATLSRALPTAAVIPLTLTPGTAEAGDYGSLASITIAANALEGTGTITTVKDTDSDDETFTVALGSLPSGVAAGAPSSVEVTITDLDTPTVSLFASPNPVDEGKAVTVTATLSRALPTAAVIPLTLTPGTAEAGDYGSLASITIAANAEAGTGTITTVRDTDFDDETFTVALGDLPSEVVEGTPSSVLVTIREKPAVHLSANPNPVDEGSSVTVTATLSGALPTSVTIPLTQTPGTAEKGDYGGLASITIAANSLEGTGTITTVRDTDSDDETFTVALGDLPSEVVAGTPSSELVTITDLDTPTVSLSASPNPVKEGSSVTVTATLSSALSTSMTIPLTLTPGTAEKGDYGSLASITIAANSLEGTGTITTVRDTDFDDETFTVALGSLPSEVAAGSPSSELVTITDLDTPTVSLSASPNPVKEGSSVTVTATLSSALSTSMTIPLTLTPGTAEKGDYGSLASITIAANSLEGTGTITTVRDTDFDDETFTVALGDLPSEVVEGSPSSEEVEITDLDTPPVTPAVHLSATTPVNEGSSVTVTATLSQALPAAVTIPLTYRPGAVDPAETGDYGSLASITIAANALTGTGTITTVKDADSDDETFTVALGSLPSEVVAGTPSSVLVTIREKPAVSLSANPNPVDEGSSVTVTATLSQALPAAVTIPLTLTPGTAEKGDYGGLASITIAANSLEGTGTITTVRDTDFDDETFTVALGDLPSEVAAGSPSSELVTIRDTPTVSLSASPNPVKEGSSVTVTATLSSALSTSMTIPLTLTPGTAEKGDYGSLASITIAANSLTGTGTITTVKDADSDDETFTVALGDLPSEVVAGTPSSVLVTIRDTPTVSLSASPNPVDEGEDVTVTARLSRALPTAAVIPLTLTPGTAEAGDYGSLASITIAANSLEGTGTITTVKDADSDNETFTVALGDLPSEVAAGTPSSVGVEITDLDTPAVILPNVSLSASPNPVGEGSSVTVTATLSSALPAAVTIPLTYRPGAVDPAEPNDYVPVSEITIISGSGSGTAVVRTTPDNISEGGERFVVALGTLPADVEAGHPSEVEITIIDDDDPPPVEVTLSVDPEVVDEGDPVTVRVTLANPLETAVTIPLAYTPYTSEPGDYIELKQVTVAGEETEGTGQIVTIADTDTQDERFIVSLGDLDPAVLEPGLESSHWVTIRDRVPPEVVRVDLFASTNPVAEGEAVTVTVKLSEELPAAVTIPLVLTPGSADAQDYHAAAPMQVRIEREETSGTYVIRTTPDEIDEEDETFTVRVGALPEGMVAGDSLDITIEDDDAVGIEASPSISLLEGGTEEYRFSLASEPLGAVTVTMDWPRGTDLTVSPITRIFTPSDWNEPQQVTLTADEDDDISPDRVEVTLRATGADYTGEVYVLQVTIIDKDTPGIVAPHAVRIEEETDSEFGVHLSAKPSGTVTVTVSGFAGELTASPTRLSFTTTNWETPQTVTLTAGHDDDVVDDSETLTLTADGGGYAGIEHRVTVTVEDNDEAEIVAPAEVTMAEGTQSALEVRLSAEPSGTVTIALTGHAGTQLTLDRASLTFTTTNWKTSQTVTLTAAEDDNDEEDQVRLLLTASGGGYNGVSHTTQVTITDKGPVTISIWSQQGSENAGRLQLPIELSRATDQVVTVQYASSDDTAEAGLDYTASRGVVIFDPGATRGVVEIAIIDDELPEDDETFRVTLSNARNATIARGTGTGTILDDDQSAAALRVEDARVLEEEAEVRFRVLLSQPQREMVSAQYRTRDGTARAGEDYQASSGVVTLAPGTTEAMIAVPLLKGGLDWGQETFTLHLSSSEHARIEKAVGVATIQESTTVSERVLEAYAARFVRTSSVQVVEALGDRFRSAADGAACTALERAEMAQLWYSRWDPSPGELLAGCRMSESMLLPGGSLSVWGRGAFRQFNGQQPLTLRGEVTTAMLGADYRWRGGWLAGVLLAHSRGDGSFEVENESGDITSALTGIYPYASYTRAGWEVWLSGGAGRGQAEVSELDAEMTTRFGAMGMRGTLASGGSARLRYHGDLLVTGAEIEEHAITAEVVRVRVGLEASAQITKGIRPYVEANVRQDGGSAETGTGLELGGGVRFASPAWRLRGEVRTQGLVMHTADGFTEWGFSGSLQVGNRSEGLTMSLRPSWGRAQGMSMYRQQTILDAVPIGAGRQRTDLELGYGIPWKEGTARSVMGVTQLPGGRMYRLGGQLRPWERLSVSIFGLAHRRNAAPGDIGVNVQGMLRY